MRRTRVPGVPFTLPAYVVPGFSPASAGLKARRYAEMKMDLGTQEAVS